MKPFFILLFSLSLSFTFGQTYWDNISASGSPDARENHGSSYDPASNKLFIFGGNSASGYLNDIWSLDLGSMTWEEIPVTNAIMPSARHTPEMMFNPDENTLLMWSGQTSTSLLNDVWQFDLSDSTWTELFPDGAVDGQVRQRYGGASIYDRQTRNIVNFAGFTVIGRLKDIFRFSLDSLTWVKESRNPRPIERCLHAGAYAEDRRKLVIFGGQSGGNRNDIWEMSVDSFTWDELVAPESPPARHFTSLVYRGDGELIVFGGNGFGQNNYSGALNDLWTFNMDASEWDTLPQGTTIPEIRVGHSADYLPAEDKMIVFGGRNTNGFLNDVWIYDFNPISTSVLSAEANLTDLNAWFQSSTLLVEFNAEASSRSTIIISDLAGRLIYSQQFDSQAGRNEIRIGLQDSNERLYIITLESAGNTVSKIIRNF